MRKRNGCRGVTLIELCFGVAVVATLATLAAPGFRSALRNSAVRGALFELSSALHATRASSIIEARTGVFCLSDSIGNCLPGKDSSNAWKAWLDVGGQPRPLAAQALAPGLELRATRPRLSFWPDARAASPVTLTICDTQQVARPRSIIISQTGRIRLADADAADCRA